MTFPARSVRFPLLALVLVACGADDGGGAGGTTQASTGPTSGASSTTVGTDSVGGSGSTTAPGTGSGTTGDGTTVGGTTDGGTTGGGGGGPTFLCDDPPWKDGDFATVYEVGPGKPLATPSDVPWESLTAGTLVKIFPRPEPYRDKWVIAGTGTEEAPIVVLGVADGGTLPVISGDGATTRPELDYWNEPRSIVKIGGASTPASDDPAHIVVACLEIRDARPGLSFTDDAGSMQTYADNAAAIHVEQGRNVTIAGNELHRAGNGLFAGSGSTNLRIVGNWIHDNGNPGSIYEHNSYTESRGIVFEYNHYGPLCDGCAGNNLKDRSSGTVIRYNWIEDGNRQLDLVETDDADIAADPAYGETFVYGNVLVEGDGEGNSQIVHYGGDGGDTSLYRAGTLYFYFNTVVSTRSGNTTLVRLSTEVERIEANDNIVFVTAGGDRLGITTGTGTAVLTDNWLPQGWVPSHDTLTGSVMDAGNLEGTDPGFVDGAGQDFRLAPDSACRDAAGPLPAATAAYPVTRQYVVHQGGENRPDDGAPDLGAFEAR
ncbi:MAG: right-handed parallel beta-helix repeat-containing protein [Deltaproteobacteria bacterium]|nr:MAG: right-handed parallel beta-helix repeat-containing protein [Deltaproteobacteria bacterium]